MSENSVGASQTRPESERLLLTLNEAAERLAISKRTLEREISAGRFGRPVKIGRATRVLAVDIETYVRRLVAAAP